MTVSNNEFILFLIFPYKNFHRLSHLALIERFSPIGGRQSQSIGLEASRRRGAAVLDKRSLVRDGWC